MTKMWKAAVTSLVMVLILVTPACRTRRTPAPVTTTAAVDQAPPEVAPPPAETTPRVAEPTDFVQPTAEPREEVIPTDIEELNRWAHQRGHIRDAFFNYDEATLDASAQEALASSARWLRAEGAAYNLLIEGHCDERGTEQYNLALGDRRANTAKNYLVTLGVDARRIRTVSYGEERPFETGSSESAWAQNRRAHLVLVR